MQYHIQEQLVPVFLLYINDFPSSTTFTCHLYTNDTILLLSHKNLKTLENIVNNKMNYIAKWMEKNKLTVNSDKTQ